MASLGRLEVLAARAGLEAELGMPAGPAVSVGWLGRRDLRDVNECA
jgi:hypothetical protein